MEFDGTTGEFIEMHHFTDEEIVKLTRELKRLGILEKVEEFECKHVPIK